MYYGLPVNLTFRWANLGKKGKHVSLIFLGLHCVGPNFEQLTMMVKLLLLSSRLRRYCQIFIEYISAIDDKDLWYGYFCRNLIEWRRTEWENWANEQKMKWRLLKLGEKTLGELNTNHRLGKLHCSTSWPAEVISSRKADWTPDHWSSRLNRRWCYFRLLHRSRTITGMDRTL